MSKPFLTFFLALSLFHSTAHAQVPEPGIARKGFVENLGQLRDAQGHPVPEVQFLCPGAGLNMQLKRNGFSYDTWTQAKGEGSSTLYQFHRVDVSFLGSNADAVIEKENATGEITHYYGPNYTDGEGITVQSWEKVTIHNLYEGISVAFYINPATPTGIEYDFIMQPGADASQIRMKYAGMNSIALNKGNELEMTVNGGTLTESLPSSYLIATGEKVPVQYQLNEDHIVSFSAPQLLASAWVIDPFPTLLWGTYYGGSGDEFAWDLAVDGNGDVLTVGTTTSPNAIATAGAFQTAVGGGQDFFIVKFNSAGQRIWSTYYGGTGTENGSSIICGTDNSIYVIAEANSSGMATAGAHQTTFGGVRDAFLAKFNSSGVRQWATYYGGSGDDTGSAIDFDAAGFICFGGGTSSSTGISTGGAHQTSLAGSSDMYFAKFNTSGVRQWGTYFGGTGATGFEYCRDIRIDASGNIFLCGTGESNNGYATAGAFQTVFAGGGDGVVAKFNSSGVRQWATYWGGTGSERITGIDVNSAGEVYVAGITNSTSGITSAGAHQTTYGGGTFDAFFGKFNSTGTSRVWGTYLGGGGEDLGGGARLTFNGDVIFSGPTQSNSGISTANAMQTVYGGGGDNFLARVSPAGTVIWSTYFGNTGSDGGFYHTVAPNDDIYMTGNSSSTSGIATAGTHQTTNNLGPSDVFVVKFSTCTPTPVSITPSGPTTFCSGGNVTLDAGAGFTTYLWSTGATTQTINVTAGNTYTVTVTNASGCPAIDAEVITVNASPTPVITPAGPTTFCAGGSVLLNAGAGYTTYAWSTGATTQSITVSAGNTYTVTVTNGSGCSGSDSEIVTVNANPTPVIVPAGPTTFCAGGSVTLDAGAGYTTYAWSTSASTQTINVTAGNTYSVTVTNSNGCSGSDSEVVTVNGNPTPVIVPSGATTFCAGGNVTLDAGAGFTSYAWSSGASTQTINVSAGNTYTVTVTNGNGCSGSDSEVVTVNANPTPVIAPSGATTFCAGDNVTLNAGAGYTTYAWSNSASTQTINVSSGATYSVTVTNSNGCSGSDSEIVTVNPNPTPTITPMGPTTFCDGGTVTLDAGSGYIAYAWTGGNSAQTFFASSSNTYTVTVTDGNGCTGTDDIAVTVNPNPTPVITPSGPTALCTGESVTLDAGPGFSAYVWTGGSTGQTLLVNTADIFTVIVTDTNGCTGSSPAVTTTLTAAPVAAFTYSATTTTVTFTDQSTGNPNSWNWNFGDSNSSLSQNPQHTYANAGVYQVCLTAYSGTCPDSVCETITVTDVGRDEFSANAIHVYPNPTDGGLFIESERSLQVEVIDMRGVVVLTEQVLPGKQELNLSALAEGVYLLKGMIGEEVYWTRVEVF